VTNVPKAGAVDLWHDAKASQDYSEKKRMVSDALWLPGLSADQHEQLRVELGRAGPVPAWLGELLGTTRP
jgi:hypothetical protein